MTELRKSLITADDLSIGVGVDIQNRNGSELQLNKINASTILGVLVVNNKTTLDNIAVEKLTTKVALTQDTSDIYVYNNETQRWEVKTKNIYVIDTYTNIDKVPEGQDIVYAKADNVTYYRSNDGWVANSNSLFIVNTQAELSNVPRGINMCICKDDGTLWTYGNNVWKQVTIRLTEELVLYVEELDDLPEDTTIEVAIVKNNKTGGIFVYDRYSTEQEDGALVIGKWKRQRTGSGVSVLWFGAQGDGVTDDAVAFTKALKHGHVVIPEKTYKIGSQVVCNNDIIIDGNNATIKFEGDGCFKFTGKAGTPIDISADFTGGTNVVSIFSGTFEKDSIIRLKSNTMNSFSEFGVAYSQLNRVVKQDGLSLTLYHPAYITYAVNSQVTTITPVIVTINKLQFIGQSSFTFLQFEYCADSVINNLSIETDGSSAVKFKDCFNMVVENCIVHSVGDGTINAIDIDSSDNIVLQNNSIYGNTTSIIFSGDLQSNIVLISNSILTSNTSAIDTDGKVFSLNVQNSMLSGSNIKIGGRDIKFDTCSIIVKGFIYQTKHVGGDFSFVRCKFTGLSTMIDAPFIRIDSPGINNFKMNAPYKYMFSDCEFTLANAYNSVAEFYAMFKRSTQGSKAALKSNITIENVIITSPNNMATGVFRLYGHFNSVNIANLKHTNSNFIPLNMHTLKSQIADTAYEFTDKVTKIQELTVDIVWYASLFSNITQLIYNETLDKKYFTLTTGMDYWNNSSETLISNQTKAVLLPRTFVKSTK